MGAMALGHNIQMLRAAAGWTLAHLGQKVGTSPQTIYKLEKTDARRSEYAGAIARAFGLPGVQWLTHTDIKTEHQAEDLLLLSKGPLSLNDMATPGTPTRRLVELGMGMLPAPQDWDSEAERHYQELDQREEFIQMLVNDLSSPPSFDSLLSGNHESNAVMVRLTPQRVPVLSYVQAGAMTEAGCVDLAQVYDEYITTDLDLSEQAFALEIKGDSMIAPPGSGEESFNEGDRIIVDCTVTPLPGDFVVARNGEHEATFKKYRPRGVDEQGRDVFELVPLNPDYPTIRSDRQPVQIIGVMVEHRRYRRKK